MYTKFHGFFSIFAILWCIHSRDQGFFFSLCVQIFDIAKLAIIDKMI
jgi:hypothetical protein